MPENKYKDAISKIEASEELKEKIKSRVELETQNKKDVKRGRFIMKIRKFVTAIAGIAAAAACGGLVYAGLTGNNLNIFNNKVSTEYSNYAKEVENKFVEDEYGKISLKSLACDDAYLILELKLDVTEKGQLKLDDIKNDNITGLKLNLNNKLTINDKEYDSLGTFTNQVARKDSKTEATIYKMYDLTDLKLDDEFEIKLDEFSWMREEAEDDASEMISDKLIDGEIKLKVSKKDANKDTEVIDPEIDKYEYENVKLEVEKIVKTPFETFMVVNAREKVIDGRFAYNRDDMGKDLYINVYDENGNVLQESEKYTGKLLLKDGSYWSEEGEVLDLAYVSPTKDEDIEDATIESRYIITLGNRIDDVSTINVKPYYRGFIDNGRYEEEYLTSLKWYKVEDGKYTIEGPNGAEVKVSKVDIKEDRILFHYTKNDKVADVTFFVRNKDRAFNFMYTDIEEVQDKGEYVVGIKTVNNESAGMITYEDGDTDETADLEKYSYNNYLKDINSLVFTVDLGDESMIEFLGEGLIINFK